MITAFTVIAELLCGCRPQSGAPWVRKFGKLTIQEFLVLTPAYAHLYVRTDSGGGGGRGVPRQPNRGRRILFLARNGVVILGNQRSRCLWKRGFFKNLSIVSKTIFRQCQSFELEKKYLISINKLREKVQKEYSVVFFGGRRKVQVMKFAFKDYLCCDSSTANSVCTMLKFVAIGSGPDASVFISIDKQLLWVFS